MLRRQPSSARRTQGSRYSDPSQASDPSDVDAGSDCEEKETEVACSQCRTKSASGAQHSSA